MPLNTPQTVLVVEDEASIASFVSLYLKNGPEISHATIRPNATMNAQGRPVARDVALAQRVNTERDFVGRTEPPSRER